MSESMNANQNLQDGLQRAAGMDSFDEDMMEQSPTMHYTHNIGGQTVG